MFPTISAPKTPQSKGKKSKVKEIIAYAIKYAHPQIRKQLFLIMSHSIKQA
jgi:hypothetical protein